MSYNCKFDKFGHVNLVLDTNLAQLAFEVHVFAFYRWLGVLFPASTDWAQTSETILKGSKY